MRKRRFKVVPSVFLILIKDGKIFMLRRYDTGHQDGNYSLIAGHVDKNESIKEAIKREAKEEAGIDIDIKNLKLIHIAHRVKEERINFFFTINFWKNEPCNNEPEKCDDICWFTLNKLPNNIAPYIKKAIKNYQKNIIFAEYK